MSIYKSYLFSSLGQQSFAFKTKSSIWHISPRNPKFHASFIGSRAQSNRLIWQNYGLFFLQAKRVSFLFTGNNDTVSRLFLIKKHNSFVWAELPSKSEALPYLHILKICSQSDLPEQKNPWNERIWAHPLAKEVTDYLGGSFFSF